MNNSYKTAITRTKLSSPMRFLKDNNHLIGDCLDYGCGKGFDADYLKIKKYDPHFHNFWPDQLFDTITCNYVLNVIDHEEAVKIIKRIQSLLKWGGIAYITVRRDIENEGITKKGTLQRNVYLNAPTVVETTRFHIYCITRIMEGII
jgi:SAM-dependent methyltransferase